MPLSSAPGVAGLSAVAAWLIAAGLLVWRGRLRSALATRLIRALIGLGLLLSTVSWLSGTVGVWPDWTPPRAIHAAGIAIVALIVPMALTFRQPETTAILPVLVGALGLQSLAMGAACWAAAPWTAPGIYSEALVLWLIGQDAAAIVASALLTVSLGTSFAVERLRRWRPEPDAVAFEPLARAGDRTLRGALMSLTLAVTLAAVRSWLGWGDIVHPGMPGLLVGWLLLMAAFSGGVTGSASLRLVQVLELLALVAVSASVLGFV
jgi:hypothetical protein